MSLAQVLQSFWPFHGPPDGRSEREIDDDLDAEFAFHLEQAQRDLVHEGHDREAASELAHARFGDVDRIKRECRRIALKERTMLQRVNFIMMIVVLLMVVAVGVQVLITQRYNTLALQEITAEITNMKYDALAAEREGNGATSASGNDSSAGRVLAAGDVERPAWYPIPLGRLMYVREMLDQLGVRDDQWVSHRGPGAASSEYVPALEFRFGAHRDSFLRPHAEIHVRSEVPASSRRNYFLQHTLRDQLSTIWVEVPRGSDVPGAWTIQLSAADRNYVGGRLYSSEAGGDFGLSLASNNAMITGELPGSERLRGAWDYLDERLVLDFSEAETLPPDGVAYGEQIVIPGELRSEPIRFQLSDEPVAVQSDRQASRSPVTWDGLTSNHIGRWVQVDSQGLAMEDGLAFELISSRDMRNMRGVPTAILSIPQMDEQLELQFRIERTANLVVINRISGVARADGRWKLEDDVLTIYIGDAVPALHEILMFKRELKVNATKLLERPE